MPPSTKSSTSQSIPTRGHCSVPSHGSTNHGQPGSRKSPEPHHPCWRLRGAADSRRAAHTSSTSAPNCPRSRRAPAERTLTGAGSTQKSRRTVAVNESSNMAEGDLLLEVTDLVKHFPIKSGVGVDREVARVRAVDGVSLSLHEGETLGLVGESGCGKSTLCRAILQLTQPTSGSVRFLGEELVGRSRRDLRPLRRDMQMIFQDPYASLNPRKRVGQIVGDPMELHGLAKGADLKRRVQELLDRVGLSPEHYNRYPHEFSGGQRQRIGIARALALQPKFIVADEPVSALDVSVQAQIINLLKELQDEFGLSYLFVGHDLRVVRHVSHRVALMYVGKVFENAATEDLYRKPIHPYTNALLSAVPIPDPKRNAARERLVLAGDVPSPIDPPPGCSFHTRCPWGTEICTTDEPALLEHASAHVAACHHPRNVEEPAAQGS